MIIIKSAAKKTLIGTLGAASLLVAGTQVAHADTVKVQSGDTVWAYSQKYHVSIDSIVKANKLADANLILAGHSLNIPGVNTSDASQTSTAAASTASAAAVDGKYTVQAGDTLSELSARFGISVATLQQINQLSDSNLIVAGQTLSVTSAASSASSASNTSATSAAEQTATEDSAASAASSTTNSSEAVASSANTTATSSTASSTAASSATSSSKTSTTTSSSSTSTTQQSTASSATSTASSTSNNSNLATGSVVSLAVKLANANIPYVWGGNSLSGMDCSGLVQYVYANADGISLPHNTVAQEAYVTKHSVASAKPGDILFWGNSGATYHDAIYIGNNQFVAAPSTGQNVKVQTISSYFMPSFAGTVK